MQCVTVFWAGRIWISEDVKELGYARRIFFKVIVEELGRSTGAVTLLELPAQPNLHYSRGVLLNHYPSPSLSRSGSSTNQPLRHID